MAIATRDRAMEIERTAFGTITIDGKTYDHDVVIRLSGEIVKRKKKLSKKYYGTSHVLSKDEAKFVFEKGCEQLIIGSGQVGKGLFHEKRLQSPVAADPQGHPSVQRVDGKKGRSFSRDLLRLPEVVADIGANASIAPSGRARLRLASPSYAGNRHRTQIARVAQKPRS